MDQTVAISTILLDNGGRPRDAALKTLAWLQGYLNARSVTLWRLEEDALVLALGHGTDSLAVVNAQELWRDRSPDMDPAAPMWGESGVLVRAKPAEFLIHVDGVDRRAVTVDDLVRAGTIAANALLHAASPTLMPHTMSAMKREEIIARLNLHEWNIARTARSFGKTRKTLYDWLEKYQIPRQRFAK